MRGESSFSDGVYAPLLVIAGRCDMSGYAEKVNYEDEEEVGQFIYVAIGIAVCTVILM